MKVIGITGGIGSGKSYVAALAAANFDVLHIQTDNIARRQMQRDGASYLKVVEAFGESILDAEGEINRPLLSKLVFEDEVKLKILNSITHPQVTETVMALLSGASDLYTAALVETAILKEAGYSDFCDEIWYVHANAEERLNRLIKTRGITREKALSVMAAQQPDSAFYNISTAVIENHDSTSDMELIERIGELLKER